MTKCVNELNMILFFSFSSPSLKSGGIVFTHRVLSCPVLPCPVLSCPVLSYPALFSLFYPRPSSDTKGRSSGALAIPVCRARGRNVSDHRVAW